MKGKHAYLIIAHKNPEQLRKLLKLLDDIRNDIFILIDKKSKVFIENANIKKVCKESKIVFLDRMNIYWGGYSQVKAEILLLESAIKFGGGGTPIITLYPDRICRFIVKIIYILYLKNMMVMNF